MLETLIERIRAAHASHSPATVGCDRPGLRPVSRPSSPEPERHQTAYSPGIHSPPGSGRSDTKKSDSPPDENTGSRSSYMS